jgi:hypothetical protein
MQLATLIERYDAPFRAKYGEQLLPEQIRALAAIARCRTSAAGELLWACGHHAHHPLS